MNCVSSVNCKYNAKKPTFYKQLLIKIITFSFTIAIVKKKKQTHFHTHK